MANTTTDILQRAPSLNDPVALTSGGAWTYGAWVEVIASTANAITIAGVSITPGSWGEEQWEVQVGTGTAGNEVSVMGTDGHFRYAGGNDGNGSLGSELLLPAPLSGLIPSGRRVCLRTRNNNDAISASLLYYNEPLTDLTNLADAGEVVSSIPSGADGVSITPSSTPWAFNSSHVELTAATATEIAIFGAAVSVGNSQDEYELWIYTGAAGSEVALTTFRGSERRSSGLVNHVYVTPNPVPAGTRLSMRLRTGGTGTNAWKVALLTYATDELLLTVDAGPDQSVTLPITAPVLMDGAVTGGDAPTWVWTQVDGPGTVSFSDDTDLAAIVSFPPAVSGTYTLRLTASSGGASVSDDMDVDVGLTAAPTPDDPCTGTTPRYCAAFRVFHSQDGGVGTGYQGFHYGKGPFRDPSDYYYGWKAPRLLDPGTIRLSASDPVTGALSANSATAKFADTDRALRALMDGTQPVSGDPVYNAVFPPSWVAKSELFLYHVDDVQRRALSDGWRLLFRGIISDDPLSEYLTYTVTAKDIWSADYHLFRDDKMAPQRTIHENDFPAYPDSRQLNGVPIIYGNVTDEDDDDVGELKIIYVGSLTVNGLTKACGLICGHACKAIRLYQDNTEIPANDANAWWPDSDNWTDFVPSGDRFVDLNSRRYSLVFVDGARATDFISGDKPIYANVQGITTNADGTGTLIEDYFPVYLHLCEQWLTQTYDSGVWANAPSFPFMPKPFSSDPDTAFLTVFDADSFDDAQTTSEDYVTGGFKAAFVLGASGRRTSIRQVLQDLNLGGNVMMAPNATQQLGVTLLPLLRADFLSGARSVGKRDILRTPTFRIDRMSDWLGNHLTYEYQANYRGDEAADYLAGDELFHNASIAYYGDPGHLITFSRAYPFVRHAGTADAVAQAQLNFCAIPRDVVTWGESLCGLKNPLLAGLPLTHYAGRSAAGWTDRALWKISMDIDTGNSRVTSRAIDVDDLLT